MSASRPRNSKDASKEADDDHDKTDNKGSSGGSTEDNKPPIKINSTSNIRRTEMFPCHINLGLNLSSNCETRAPPNKPCCHEFLNSWNLDCSRASLAFCATFASRALFRVRSACAVRA